MRRENQLLRERQLIDERRQNLEVSRDDAIMNSSAGNQERTNDDRTPEQSTNGRASISTKVNMTMLADLLSPFSGNAEKNETWERQVMFLKQTYNLEDEILRILIGTRLKGRAMEWFYSKPIYIAMPSDDLLVELRKMFHHRPDKITMGRRFEERVWTKTETFHDYVHEKMILANHLGMDDDEVLSYIIDGIPDVQLRDVARLQGFRTSQSLLQAFEEISLSGRNFMSNSDAKSDSKGDGGKRKYDKSDSDVKTKNDEKKCDR